MISFRFHLISITAIFLAMAIGVLVGSTFVDRAIVDGLRNRINTVENNLDDRRAENAALARERDRLSDYVAADADYAVTGRLTEAPLLLMAMRGVNEGTVDQLALLALRAGAVLPGVIWVEEKLALADEAEVTELQSILDVRLDSVPGLQSLAFESLLEEVSVPVEDPAPGTPGPTTSTTIGTSTTVALGTGATPVLDALLAGRFLSFEPIDEAAPPPSSLAGSGPRLLLVTGRAEESIATLPPLLAGAAIGSDTITVIADVFVAVEDGPGRGEGAAALFPEEGLGQLVFVDAADLVEGRVAAVLALDAAADGVTGHFGFGPGADAVIPQWSPP